MNHPLCRKKQLACLVLLQTGFFLSQGQSTVRKQVNGPVSNHTITRLIFLRPDKYNQAVNDQLGVFGNNFFGDQVLTTTTNHNSYESTLTPTDYFTVKRPGPKMTLCGKVIQHEFSSGYVDDDLNIQIVANPKAPVFDAKYTQIKNRGRNAYPWAMIEGEIDISSSSHQYFSPASNFAPRINLTDVCLYGPWVEEVYQGDEDVNPNKDHTDVHEIHPAEQFWWIEKTPSGFRYCLNAAIDASDRFQETGWAPSTMHDVFAIAFDISRNRKEKLSFTIKNVGNRGVTSDASDGQKHYLIFQGDTLVQVIEPTPDLMSISFEEIGLDPYAASSASRDSVIKGFLVIRNTISSTGNLKLVVDKNVTRRVHSNSTSSNFAVVSQSVLSQTARAKRVKITLKEISTLDNFLGNHQTLLGQHNYFDLTGYIYVDKVQEPGSFSEPTSTILDRQMPLLFPNFARQDNRVIRHSFNHPKTSIYNNSVVISLLPGDKIKILSDFEAQYQSDYVRTLDLSEGRCYEWQTSLDELQQNRPLLKEFVMQNTEKDPHNDPKRYKMKIKFEFLLMD